MYSCVERTSGLEDILVQGMRCNSSIPHLRSLHYLQRTRSQGLLRGFQDHVLCVTDDGWCSWRYGKPLGLFWCYFARDAMGLLV